MRSHAGLKLSTVPRASMVMSPSRVLSITALSRVRASSASSRSALSAASLRWSSSRLRACSSSNALRAVMSRTMPEKCLPSARVKAEIDRSMGNSEPSLRFARTSRPAVPMILAFPV